SGFYVCMRRPPRSTLFPTRRSSDLGMRGGRCRAVLRCSAVGAVVRARLPCDESGAVLAGSRPGWGVAEVRRCGPGSTPDAPPARSEEHTSELQSRENLVCRLLLVKT